VLEEKCKAMTATPGAWCPLQPLPHTPFWPFSQFAAWWKKRGESAKGVVENCGEDSTHLCA